jgi:hypothetical protein
MDHEDAPAKFGFVTLYFATTEHLRHLLSLYSIFGIDPELP